MVSSQCGSRYCDLFTAGTKGLSFFSVCLVHDHISPSFLLGWYSRYKINCSHFSRSGLKWCNMRAHKRTISVSTIDFRPTLTYESTSAHLRRQRLTSFYAVCGVLFDYKRKSTVVSSGVRDVTLVTNICYQSAECLHANFCNQTWYCGASRWAGMSCEKTGILSSRSRSQCGLI